MKTLNILLFLLIFTTFVLLGFLVSESNITGQAISERISVNITRVIDGDTIVYETNQIRQTCRLLGINTPEKKQPYYEDAKLFLQQYEGKQVELEDRGKDKYDRTLGYIFYNSELINKKQLENGYATLYYYGEDNYYNDMEDAEEQARNNNAGLWGKSDNYGCIKIIEFEPVDNEYENETLVLENTCSIILNVIIKDDANHIYDEIIKANSQLTLHFKDIFNDDGDSLYVRDDSGLLLFYRY